VVHIFTIIDVVGFALSDGVDGAWGNRAVQDPDQRADVMDGRCPPLFLFLPFLDCPVFAPV